MLSDSIREMRRNLQEYDHSGLEMSPEAVDAWALMLRSFETEARNLEERLASLDAIGHVPVLPMDGKVVPFRARPS